MGTRTKDLDETPQQVISESKTSNLKLIAKSRSTSRPTRTLSTATGTSTTRKRLAIKVLSSGTKLEVHEPEEHRASSPEQVFASSYEVEDRSPPSDAQTQPTYILLIVVSVCCLLRTCLSTSFSHLADSFILQKVDKWAQPHHQAPRVHYFIT